MYIERNLDFTETLKRKSVFLFGPRQCGKSSLVDHILSDAHVFDLLSAETLIRLTQDPGYILRRHVPTVVSLSLTKYRNFRLCWMKCTG